MSTTPKCPICHDSGKTIHADGQQSAYLDCGCGAATARAELNQAVAAFAIINRDDLDCDWFIHQRAKALGRAEALAELHPLWLAEKERADRAEARIAELEAQLAAQAPVREVPEPEPDMLWEAAEPEDGVTGNSPKDFAENYASAAVGRGETHDVEVLCCNRTHNRTMRVTVSADEDAENWLHWEWVDALPTAPVQQEGE